MERKRNVFTINGKKTHDCQEEEEGGEVQEGSGD